MTEEEAVIRTVPDDRDLLDSARAGSSSAMQELWRRHRTAAERYAASLTRRFDPDDLVSEAFLRVFSALSKGAGPADALRPYLFVTIRNLAASWARDPISRSLEEIEEPGYDSDMSSALVAAANRNKLQEALRSLPEQWQQILWATEIQGRRPAELSQAFNLRANSVAALSYRAREALKQAWVQVHVQEDLGSGDHRWVRERVGRYVCRALTPRQRARFQEHIDSCGPCATIVRDAEHLAVLPIGVSALVLLASAAAPSPFRAPDATATALAPLGGGRVRRAARSMHRNPVLAITATASAAVVVAAVAFAAVPDPAPVDSSSPAPGLVGNAASPAASGSPPGSSSATPDPTSSDRPPTPAPPAPPLARGPQVRIPPSAGPDPAPPSPAPSTRARLAPSSVFTLSSIAAGSDGIATIRITNDGAPLTQRTDTVVGSSAVFHAPPGVVFVAQDSLPNDYQYAGAGRTSSAIAFTRCVTDNGGETLRCDVEPARPDPPEVLEWVWNPGDTRRIYPEVTVAANVTPGSLSGTAELSLSSAPGSSRLFAQAWTIDVPELTDSSAPTVDSIDPTGEPIIVAGSAPAGRIVTITGEGRVLGTATVDDRGRWSVGIDDAATGALTATLG